MKTFEDFKEKFGKNVRRLRILRNLSQEDLANNSGFTDKQYISKVELGKADTKLSSIFKLSKALDVEPKDLLIFENEENDNILVKQ